MKCIAIPGRRSQGSPDTQLTGMAPPHGIGQDPPVVCLESRSSVFPRYHVVKTNIPGNGIYYRKAL